MTEIGLFSTKRSNTAPSMGASYGAKISEGLQCTTSGHLYIGGPLGHTACHGLLVHTTLAITPERVPLGLLAQQVWARDPADAGKRARRKHLPISQKESQKW